MRSVSDFRDRFFSRAGNLWMPNKAKPRPLAEFYERFHKISRQKGFEPTAHADIDKEAKLSDEEWNALDGELTTLLSQLRSR